MAGIGNQWEFVDDFFGGQTLATAGQGSPWAIADTSAAGTPTYVTLDGAPTGVLAITLASTSEVENVCLFMNDILCFDIDLIKGVEFRVQMGQAALDSASSLAFGLTGDRNDAIDSIAQAALFRVIGADSTTNVVVESDDGTNNNDDVATNQALVNAWKRFKIDFSQGTSDVRFFMDDGNGSMSRVASGTTFDMSNYTGSLQPFLQLQKTADTNTDSVQLDYVKVWGIRQAA